MGPQTFAFLQQNLSRPPDGIGLEFRWGETVPAHLQITVMKYLTPSGFDISKRGGVIPNVQCSDYPRAGRVSAQEDTCIQQALRALQL